MKDQREEANTKRKRADSGVSGNNINNDEESKSRVDVVSETDEFASCEDDVEKLRGSTVEKQSSKLQMELDIATINVEVSEVEVPGSTK